MTIKKELLESSKKVLSFWPRMLKYALIFCSIAIGLLVLVAIMKIWFIHSMYFFYLGKIVSAFGLDLLLSKVIAVFATVISILLLPWVISFLFLGRKKIELIIAVSIIFSICSLALYYGTNNVFFDRATGKPAKYYIKTIDGFKFSSSPNYDSRFGIKYKPINGDVIKEYYFWQKTGNLDNIPQVQPGKYFNMITGEPIVWYIERVDKKIELFSLPGYDPMTGGLLKPITKVIIPKLHNKTLQKKLHQVISRGVKSIDSEIIKLVKKEKFDFDYYFSTKENAIELQSETVCLPRNLYGGPKYKIFAEKIIFLYPSYTILGICFQGIRYNTSVEISGGRLLDHKGVKYFPIYCIGASNSLFSEYIKINKGEIKRVFYVFKYISPDKLMRGAYTGNNNKGYIKFVAKSLLKRGSIKGDPDF